MNNEFVSEIAKAKGLGSSRSGSSHWFWQRISALFLVPIYVWFIISFLYFFINPEQVVGNILYNPVCFIAFLLMINVSLFHGVLGVRVVIEDYIHHEFWKNALLILSYFLTFISMISISFILIVNFIANI